MDSTFDADDEMESQPTGDEAEQHDDPERRRTMKFAAHDRGTARTLIRTATAHSAAYEAASSLTTAGDRRVDGRADSRAFTSVPGTGVALTGRGGFSGHGQSNRPTSLTLGASDGLRPSHGVNFTYHRGQRLLGPNDGGGLFYVVRAGCIRLYKTLPDGRSINLGLLGPNTIFTQEDRSDGLATGLVAEALVDSTVSVIEQDDLAAMITQSPELAIALVDGMTRRLTGLQTLVEQILARDVTVRLATMLLTLAERFGRPMPDGLSKIGLAVPHQLLANMIGSNRVTVTRKLSDLRAAGLTRSLGRNLIAVDPDKLRAYIQASSRSGAETLPTTGGEDA